MAKSIYFLFFTVALGVFAEARVLYDCDSNLAPRHNQFCGNVLSSGLNSSQIQEILDAFRANNVGSLTWSDELARQAQAWTNSCQSSVGQCYSDYNRMSVTTSNSNESLSQMINSLYHHTSFEFPAFTFPTFTMPTFTMPNFEMPSFTMPNFEMPSFTMPTFTMPTFTMPTFTIPDVKIPDFEMPTFTMPDYEMPDFETSIFGTPDESEFRRDTSSPNDYLNMIGCGFTTFENRGRVTRYLECFTGPIIVA